MENYGITVSCESVLGDFYVDFSEVQSLEVILALGKD